jgi:hypothetical protein
MAKNEQVKRLIELLVQKEVRRLLPEAVKQVLGGIISEAVVDLSDTAISGNAHKRRAITEVTSTDSWPTLGGGVLDTSRMADMMGYGDMRSGPSSRGVSVDMAMTENGTPIPIDPRSIPKELHDAFNRDYSGLVKAWDKKKNGS